MSKMMKIKVESTETGEVFNMRLEDRLEEFKFQLSLLIPITPQDQILLIGPPYKVLDNQYGSNLQTEGKRVFVFNRKMLSEEMKEPQRIRLFPQNVGKPGLNDQIELFPGTYSFRDSDNSSVGYLKNCEKIYQQVLKRVQCYVEFAQGSIKSCTQSITQHQVQLDGIGAAVENLKDTFSMIAKPYESLEKKLTKQQDSHLHLLENFNLTLDKLNSVPIHPSLKDAINKLKTTNPESSSGKSENLTPRDSPTLAIDSSINTLLDCIPVERERAYVAQSLENHHKVEEHLDRIRALFEEVQDNTKSLQIPKIEFDKLSSDLEECSKEKDKIIEIFTEIRQDYKFLYEAKNHCFSLIGDSNLKEIGKDNTYIGEMVEKSNKYSDSTVVEDRSEKTINDLDVEATASSTDGLIERILTENMGENDVLKYDNIEGLINEVKKRHEKINGFFWDNLEQHVNIIKERKKNIERSQNWLVRTIYRIMRQIAILQTDIQYKLKKDVEWMKRWTSGHHEYFQHLGNIDKLPLAYNRLLNEIVRRKKFQKLFDGEIDGFTKKMSEIRKYETTLREGFMRNYGLHLPPIFFKVIPSLKEKPPYFSPSTTDTQWLPNIIYEEIEKQGFLEQSLKTNSNDNKDMFSMDISNSSQKMESKDENNSIVGLGLVPESNDFQQNGDDVSRKCATLEYENTQLLAIISEFRQKLQQQGVDVSLPNFDGSLVSNNSTMLVSTVTNKQILSPTEATKKDPSNQSSETEEKEKELKAWEERLKQQEDELKKKENMVFDKLLNLRSTLTQDSTVSNCVQELRVRGAINSQLSESKLNLNEESKPDLNEEGSQKITISTYSSNPEKVEIPENVEKREETGDKEDGEGMKEENEGFNEDFTKDLVTVVEEVTEVSKNVMDAISYRLKLPLISFMDFQVGDIALFVPISVENRKNWVAFNSSFPHRFLSEQSLRFFLSKSKSKEQRVHILGKIFFIETHIAKPDSNPYDLTLGTQFYVCFVEPLVKKSTSLKSRSRSGGVSISMTGSPMSAISTSMLNPGSTSMLNPSSRFSILDNNKMVKSMMTSPDIKMNSPIVSKSLVSPDEKDKNPENNEKIDFNTKNDNNDTEDSEL